MMTARACERLEMKYVGSEITLLAGAFLFGSVFVSLPLLHKKNLPRGAGGSCEMRLRALFPLWGKVVCDALGCDECV